MKKENTNMEPTFISFEKHQEKEETAEEKLFRSLIATEMEKRTDFTDHVAISFGEDFAVECTENNGIFTLIVHKIDSNCYQNFIDEIHKPQSIENTTTLYASTNTSMPMAPSYLIDGTTALLPNQPRLGISYIFTIDNKGQIISQDKSKSVIKVHKHFNESKTKTILNSENKSEHINVVKSLLKLLSTKYELEDDIGTISLEETLLEFLSNAKKIGCQSNKKRI